MVYSFEAIQGIVGPPFRVLPIAPISVWVPADYQIEDVADRSPHGDDGFGSTKMLFDPVETAKGNSGRVYMRAARVVECMRGADSQFIRVIN